MKKLLLIFMIILLSFSFAGGRKSLEEKRTMVKEYGYMLAVCTCFEGYIFYHDSNAETLTANWDEDKDGNKYHPWCFKIKGININHAKSTRDIFDEYYNRDK